MPKMVRAVGQSQHIRRSDTGEYVNRRLEKGDYLLLAQYEAEPIVWQVIRVDGKSALIMTKDVLCFRAFSAATQQYPYGLNDFSRSSIKQWLNAEDVPHYQGGIPNRENVYLGQNPYDNAIKVDSSARKFDGKSKITF